MNIAPGHTQPLPADQHFDQPGEFGLDTISISAENAKAETRKALKKRAKRKYITQAIITRLAQLNSPLKDSYLLSYDCGNTITQKDGKLTSKYCNSRWCLTCNAIRTAKMIKGYRGQLEAMKEPYFVTLTSRNVKGWQLQSEINRFLGGKKHKVELVPLKQRMQKHYKPEKETLKKRDTGVFKKIMEAMRKRGTPINGIRKLEVTHNASADTYNPHFHLIIDGKEVAQDIVKLWLKHNENAKEAAQDIRPADDEAILELMKYSTKLASKDTDMEALDIILRALYGRRIIQPMGNIKKVSEEVDDIDAVIETESETEAVYVWSESDWYDMETGEALSGYIPKEGTLQLIETFKVKERGVLPQLLPPNINFNV